MSVEIVDNPDRHRYEAHVDGAIAGYAEYDEHNDFVAFPHTEVGKSYQGMGIANSLVRRAADDLRAKGGKAYPLCPYVTTWFTKHPEYDDVLYQP